MNKQEKQTQLDIRLAYEWVLHFAKEVSALLEDAGRLFDELGLEKVGDATAKGCTLTTSDGPFITYSGCAYRASSSSVSEPAILFSVMLHCAFRRDGPQVICGAVHGDALSDNELPWLGYYACGFAEAPSSGSRFTVSGERLRKSIPTEKGRAKYRGITDVCWFELPVAWLATPERLKRAVDATVALRERNDEPARALLAETRP